MNSQSRIDDLYRADSSAGWAKDQLSILKDMVGDRDLPYWVSEEINRIYDGITTVYDLESERE